MLYVTIAFNFKSVAFATLKQFHLCYKGGVLHDTQQNLDTLAKAYANLGLVLAGCNSVKL